MLPRDGINGCMLGHQEFKQVFRECSSKKFTKGFQSEDTVNVKGLITRFLGEFPF